MKKSIFFIFIIFNIIVYAKSPVVFVGTYTKKSDNLSAYLFQEKKYDSWHLSKMTEKILLEKYSKQLKILNIVSKNEFRKNTKKLSSQISEDRKIGFFNVQSFQNIFVGRSNFVSGTITINLTFVQLGEESNRINSNNSFETRYTIGVNSIQQLAIDEKSTLYDAYLRGLDIAIGKLLELMISDTQNKNVNSLMSNDIYFTIDGIKVNNKIQEITNEIFTNNDNAKQQLLVMFQESLIREIRKDKDLDDVVLLYPDSLNKYLFSSWKDYVKKVSKYIKSSSRDKNARYILKKIKPICKEKNFNARYKYFNGYKVQAFLQDINTKVVDETKEQFYKKGNAFILSRILLPVNDGESIDSLSTPTNINNEVEVFEVRVENEFVTSYDMKTRRDFESIDLIKESIKELAKETVKKIKNIVHLNKNNVFEFQQFCKG